MQHFNETFPTSYAELNSVLADLTRSVTAILGDNFHAAALQGSFAVGDFDRDSDVDFLIVTHDDICDAHLPALQAMHARLFSDPCSWAQHLEGSYIRKDILSDPARVGEELWYLDNGSQSLVRSTHCNSLVVRWTLHEHGIALSGPEPRSLLDPIPATLLRNEVFKTMCQWGGTSLLDDPAQINSFWLQAFAVVLYCRMLHTLHTGQVASKLAGVQWALDNLDARWSGLIRRAWAQRSNTGIIFHQPPDPDEVRSTIDFIRYAVELGRPNRIDV
jgi:predicted nucleotidyltransferase